MKRYDYMWKDGKAEGGFYAVDEVEAELAKKNGLIKEQYGTIGTLQEQRDAAWAWKKEYETELAKKDEIIEESEECIRELQKDNKESWDKRVEYQKEIVRLRRALVEIEHGSIDELAYHTAREALLLRRGNG